MPDPRVINAPENAPDWSQWKNSAQGGQVQKIVLGPSPGGEKDKSIAANLPKDLATLFPNLTHLYLWSVTDLVELAGLPAGLKCLDTRGCHNLETIEVLPKTLEELVLDNCAKLAISRDSHQTQFPNLEDLSLKGCSQITEGWLDSVLQGAPKLRKLNASDCPQVTHISEWAPMLVDVRLDGCVSLEGLAPWPPFLRRIGLRGARSLPSVPNFHSAMDYIDLAGTESLLELPKERGRPRTLFLYGSGLVTPPASEHGKTADENVAAKTKAFFEDVDLTGIGEVRRCKLLMLGNGGAGKTSLSLALVPGGNPAEAKTLGSTHGVQFWDWDFKANVGGRMEPIHLHLWDFGGQEIYHNTHRLFVSKGAVFVVLWDPSQDGKQPERSKSGYQDEWRPIQYWIDYIKLACSHKPKIALVCSNNSKKTDALEAQWRRQVSPEVQNELTCFYIDSLNRSGQLSALETWLRNAIGSIVKSQGVAVPSYWEIAQNMVQGWLRKMQTDADFASEHNQLHPDRFKESLWQAIDQAVKSEKGEKIERLSKAVASGAFDLTQDRMARTLGFLTHSGWAYWDPQLFEGRVIVGQKWALDGIYAVLEREKESGVFRALNGKLGRFTLRELGEWKWNAKYSEPEQELLRSFMESCGLCFRLRKAADAWREEDIFVSFEHLPTAQEIRLERSFNERLSDMNTPQKRLQCPRLHKYQWQRFLTDAGSQYGADAEYASDGFFLLNNSGEMLLIICRITKGGLGGEIDIHVNGGKCEERLKLVEDHIRKYMDLALAPTAPDVRSGLGEGAEIEEVFISYAWDPKQKDWPNGIPPGYEAPVNEIEKFLKTRPVRLIRDESETDFLDNIRHFMENAARRPHVIVVHSDKFWRSPYAIFELWTMMNECLKKLERSILSVIIPVEHINSNITVVEERDEYLKYWKKFRRTPVLLEWEPALLKIRASAVLYDLSKILHEHRDLNIKWELGTATALDSIRARLGLPR